MGWWVQRAIVKSCTAVKGAGNGVWCHLSCNCSSRPLASRRRAEGAVAMQVGALLSFACRHLDVRREELHRMLDLEERWVK